MNLAAWTKLADPEHADLIRAASELGPPTPAAVVALRKRFPDTELVHAALDLAHARRKAAAKFGERAAMLWADPQGVEMATSALAGAHKAARFARAFPNHRILDLCCGIGGDAMALAAAGLNVLAVDLEPVRAWMAARNAACTSLVADAAALDLPDGPFHLDPARRTADNSRRLFRYADLLPGPDAIAAIIARRRSGAIKLGPGVNASDLPMPSGELEFISESGELTQAVLWTGDLAHPDSTRTATLLTPTSVTQVRGSPDAPGCIPLAPIARFIHEVDPSVERAELLTELCRSTAAPMLHPALGLLTNDAPLAHPMLRSFEVLADFPWNQRRCREELTRLDAGIVEVKTRGKAVDPDTLQHTLRGSGSRPLVIFVLRFDRALRCIIAERLPSPPSYPSA